MDAIILRVCLFDEDCEEYPTDVLLTLTEKDVEDEVATFDAFLALTEKSTELQDIAKALGAYDFSQWTWFDVSMQTDTREGLIRLRSIEDTIGEPGNIGMMVNLRLVEV